jgi:putative thioredoxin
MTDITIQNFETELLQASMQQPVLLDIWAPWCGPCRTLGPLLEKLEVAYAGRFKLTKLNSDDQPEIAGQLSQAFGVRSIPFCVMFIGGQPVDGFVGALPEAKIREFLDKHVPSSEAVAAEEELAEAEDLLASGDVDSALQRLKDAVASDPNNDAARFDCVRALLENGRLDEALALFEPVAHKADDRLTPNPRLAALAVWLRAAQAAPRSRGAEALQAAITSNKRDFDARFELAQTLLARQQFTAAMDELLEIVMRDKSWSDELARKTYVAILELMSKPAPKAAVAEVKGTLEIAGRVQVASSDPLLDQYRRKLSMALF